MSFAVPPKNEFLLRQRCFIRGAWTGADDGPVSTEVAPIGGVKESGTGGIT